MPGTLDVNRGRWWHCSRYELRGGVICPAPDAKLEVYDPWTPYHGTRRGKGNKATPYQSLFSLLRILKFSPGLGGDRYTLTPKSEERLLDWCREYGLLGILLQRVRMVVLHPRWWTPPGDNEPATTEGKRTPELCASQSRYVRTNLGWDPYVEFDRKLTPALIRAARRDRSRAREDELVPKEIIPSAWPAPGVLIRHLTTPKLETEPLSRTWDRFFPDLRKPREDPETFKYPRPLVKEFCERYAEPLDEFLKAAVALRDTVAVLGKKIPFAEASPEENMRINRALATLHALVDSVGPVLFPKADGSFREYSVAPALLGSFALMIFQDLADRRMRFRQCKICGTPYRSTSRRARYCSGTCSRVAYKRGRRVKEQKEKKRLAKEQSKQKEEGNHGKARTE